MHVVPERYRELWILGQEWLWVQDFLIEQEWACKTSVILVRKTWYRRHFSTTFCKNVVLKQVKETVAVLAFLISIKAQLPAMRISEQPILLAKSKVNIIVHVTNFLNIFAKTGSQIAYLFLS